MENRLNRKKNLYICNRISTFIDKGGFDVFLFYKIERKNSLFRIEIISIKMTKTTLTHFGRALLIAFLAVGSFASLFARPRDVQSAKNVAKSFFQSQGISLRSIDKEGLHLEAVAFRSIDQKFNLLTSSDIQLRSIAESTPASYYVFSRGNKGGYAIVAGDDALSPIVAYSLTGSISLKDAPAYILSFFEAVDHFIQVALRRGDKDAFADMQPIRAKSLRASLPEKVDPILGDILWDQTKPWNNDCPQYPNDKGILVKCPVGCVATAVAQIMRYHEWPKTGKGSHSYEWPARSGQRISASFEGVTYNYNLMPRNLGSGEPTEAEAKELAKFCYHIGVSVNMGYTPAGSGTYSWYVGDALRNYFGYDRGVTVMPRASYGVSEWSAIIYTELANSRPVYYTGAGDGGGHAFVFDGYDNSGNVHVNWGWGGLSNGYFNMNLLNPGSLGTGGGRGGGYNYQQDCVVGIKPDRDGSSKLPQATLYYDSFDIDMNATNKELTLKNIRAFVYDGVFNGSIALAAESFDGSQMTIGEKMLTPNKDIKWGDLYNAGNLTTSFKDLKDGYYLVRPVFNKKDANGKDIWLPVRYFVLWKGSSGTKHYLLKVSENGTKWEGFTDKTKVDLTSITFKSNKAKGEKFQFKAKGMAVAKQKGLMSSPTLDDTEQELTLASNEVQIEGFYSSLTIHNAGITDFAFNRASAIEYLNLRDNKIPYLNAGHIPNVKELDLAYNEIKHLSLKGCEKVRKINLTGNPLNAKDMEKIINEIPPIEDDGEGILIVREVSNKPHSQDVWMYAVDVNFLVGRKWYVVEYNPETGKMKKYEGVRKGTEDLVATPSLMIYPTPAKDRLLVRGATLGNTLRLYSLTGVLMLEKVASSSQEELMVSNIPAGVYILKIGKESFRVLVER